MPMCSICPRLRPVAVGMVVVLLLAPVCLATVIRVTLDEGAIVVLRNGRMILLECIPPKTGAEKFFKKYLNADADWKGYMQRGGVAVRFSDLNPKTQRDALLTIFPEDYVDEKGWH